MTEGGAGAAGRGDVRDVELSDAELAIIRIGLEMLEDTFGREEAEELEEVQALLARLRGLEEGDRAAR